MSSLNIHNPFTNYLGIRGICEGTTYTQYLDSLPGISLKKSALISEEGTAKDLIDKIATEAITEVKYDFLGELRTAYQFNSIIASLDYEGSGSATFVDPGKNVSFKIVKNDRDNFTKLELDYFGVTVESDITVTVYWECGLVTGNQSVDLVEGYNIVPLNLETNENYIRVYFDADGITLGKVTNATCYTDCVANCPSGIVYVKHETGDGSTWSSAGNWGVNIAAKYRCDMDAFCNYYEADLRRAILYKAGIIWLQEALSTDRGNRYTQNSKDENERLLMQWQGGTDKVTGFQTKGEYHKKLKLAVDSVKNQMGRMDTRCLVCNSNHVVNELP